VSVTPCPCKNIVLVSISDFIYMCDSGCVAVIVSEVIVPV
jgi:hypothetical protein